MDSFENSIDVLLLRLYRDLDLLEENMLRDSSLNLSISEIHMLEAVQKVGGQGGATISALSEHLAISLPSVTSAINKIEAKGYVARQRCPTDGRVVRVRLTRQGQKAERAHRYFHRSMVREISRQLTGDEKEALISGILKLDAYLTGNIEKYSNNKWRHEKWKN